MSLAIALGRGALDIAHGLLSAGRLVIDRLFDRILDRLGVALANFELTELIGITNDSRTAAELLWEGQISGLDIPTVDGPSYPAIGGDINAPYQLKVVSRVLSTDNIVINKAPFYFGLNALQDKTGLEEYIREFWEQIRATGHDTIGITYSNIGSYRNVPIMLTRKSCKV